MIFNRSKKLKIIYSLVIVLAIAVMPLAGISDSPAQAAEPPEEIEELQQWVYDQGYNYTVAENWVTQLSPEEREALCGYKQVEAPKEPFPKNLSFSSGVPTIEAEKLGQPPSYDAMALGYVTPVKNQSSPLSCGSCWLHAAVADFESDVAIGESSLLDFSEQEVGDCNIWSSVGGYNFCLGGIALMTTNYFTKYGSADETCHPYAAIPESCYSCPLLKNVDNWRMITGDDGNELYHINTIKKAILNYGPVYSTIYASDPIFGAYSSGVYEYWGTEATDHAIEIIGWDDSLSHSHGTGTWMIKNSWGTSWGASGPYPGCGWVAYGAANLGDDTSAIVGYKNPDDTIFYHDECGWMYWSWGYDDPTAYGAVRFTPTQDMTLTAVDFWAVDANMNYEIKIFDKLDDLGGGNYAFSNQLGSTQTGSTNEPGYYSIPLNTPVPLISGDDFIVQAELTTTGYGYPVPIDYCTIPWLPPWSGIATFSGESYESWDGTQFTKPFINNPPHYTGNVDVGIRARARLPLEELEYGDAPDPTYPSLLASDGARHNQSPGAFLGLLSDGDNLDWELDANVPNLDLHDDGLLTTTITANNSSQTVTFEVTDFNAPSSDLRVNILIDLNGNGDWADAGEHVVQNQQITTSTTAGEVFDSTPFSTVGATPGPTWLRITLTRHEIQDPPWDGTMADAGLWGWDKFECGETEDWEITIEEEEMPDITVSPTSFNVTLPPDTTQDYSLNIGNAGNATLTYGISDRETTGGGGTAEAKKPSKKYSPLQKKQMAPQSPGPDLVLTNIGYDMSIAVADTLNYGRYTEATADEKLLLFSDPYAWSSYMTVQLDGSDYYEDDINMDPHVTQAPIISGDSIVTEWTLPTNVDVSQVLTLSENTTQYRVTVTNNDATSHNVKVRHLFDTMLAYEDGAPFIVPGVGNVVTEQEYNNPVFDYWKATDSLASPTLTSCCIFDPSNKPYKVQFAYWWDIYDVPFDYVITPGQDITWDTAVGMYWDLGTLSPGETKDVIVYYGTAGAIIGEPEVSITELFTDFDTYMPEDDVNIYVDVGNGGDAALVNGEVVINAENPGEVLVFEDSSTITVNPDEVISRNFTYSLPTDAIGGTYLVTAEVYDAEDTLLDDATTTFEVSAEDCPWLSENPTSGSVEPGNSDSITVTIDTTGLTEGDYSAEIVIANNDPDENPKIVPVTLHVSAEEVTVLTGLTGEVNCSILAGVTVELFKDDIQGSTTSDESGNYELTATETGNYTVTASKSGFRDETQTISVTDLGQEYTLNFLRDHALVPNVPDMSYALLCIHHWKYPSPECGISMSKALSVVHAWKYPV